MNTPSPESATRRTFVTGAFQASTLLGLTAGSAGVLAAAPANAPAYKPVKAFSSGAKAARSIASGPDGSIFVAGDEIIRVFDAEGKRTGTIALDGPAICVAVSRDGRIFAGLADHIEVFSSNGAREARWQSLGEKAALASLAVNAHNEVFASDGGNRIVWHFDSQGEILNRLNHEGEGFAVPKEFFPVAVTDHGVVVSHVGRHRIETLASDGKVSNAWGGRSRDQAGFGGCCNPISLAAMPDGRIVTAEGGLPKVKVFDRDGRFLTLVAGPEDLEANARGSHENPAEASSCHHGGIELAVDGSGRILVLDRVTSEVRIFA